MSKFSTSRLYLTVLLHVFAASTSRGAICPKTGEEWQAWREGVVSQVGSGALDAALHFSKSAFEILKSCPRSPSVDKCLKNIDAYFSAWFDHNEVSSSDGSAHMRQLTHDSQEYSKLIQANLTFPAWVDTSEFAHTLRVPGFDRAIEWINEKNQASNSKEIIRFARFNGVSFGAESPEPRLILHVPGEPERFILIRQTQPTGGSPESPPCKNAPCNADVAMLGYYPKPVAGMKVLFRESSIWGNEGPPYLNTNGFNPGDCFNCHAAGPIFIRGETRPADKDTVSFINQRFANIGPGNYGDWNRFADFGPGYGITDQSSVGHRTEGFLLTCSNGTLTTSASLERVRNAMNCTKCHDGAYRSKLTPFNTGLLRNFIMSGQMPPREGTSLSKEERGALIDCLLAEYGVTPDGGVSSHPSPVMSAWFLKGTCAPIEATSPKPGVSENRNP